MSKPQDQKLRLAVLVSGEGTNLQAIANAIDLDMLNLEIACVIANRPQAGACQKAKSLGLPVEVLDHQAFATREAFDEKLNHTLSTYAVDWVVLAGFMRQLTPRFVQQYLGRMINIHPSLLPRYPGLHTHQRVLEAGDKEHGVSVHYVTEDLDAGPVIAAVHIAVEPESTVLRLKKQIQVEEHQLLPLVLSWIAQKRLEWNHGQPTLDGFRLPQQGIQVPSTQTIESCSTQS